jgi:hypothetical protein
VVGRVDGPTITLRDEVGTPARVVPISEVGEIVKVLTTATWREGSVILVGGDRGTVGFHTNDAELARRESLAGDQYSGWSGVARIDELTDVTETVTVLRRGHEGDQEGDAVNERHLAIAADGLGMELETARRNSRMIGELLLVWSEVRGLGSVIVGPDGSPLYLSASVSPEQAADEYRAGRRTPLDRFGVLRGNPREVDVELSAAVLAYLPRGTASSPRADRESAAGVASTRRPAELVSLVEQVVTEAEAIPVDWQTLSLGDAGRHVVAEMGRRHPELSDEALEALGWNFTFVWR